MITLVYYVNIHITLHDLPFGFNWLAYRLRYDYKAHLPITMYSMYSMRCTLYTVHCTLYTVQCTLYSVHCTVYTTYRPPLAV